jgi:hypothetical protein
MFNKIKEYLTTISPDNGGTHYHWTFMDMAFPTVNLTGKIYKNPSVEQLKELINKQSKMGFPNKVRFLLSLKTDEILIWDAFDINLTFDKVYSNLNIQNQFDIISGILNLDDKTYRIDNMFFVTKNQKKDILDKFYNNKIISKLNIRGMER